MKDYLLFLVSQNHFSLCFNSFVHYTEEDPEESFADFSENSAPPSNIKTKEVLSSPSELSGNEKSSPEGRTTIASMAVGSAGLATATGASPSAYHSESENTTSDDDRRLILAPETKKKRSWAPRFNLRKKKEAKKGKEPVSSASKSKSLSLQEDSSVSSWSHGEASSPEVSMNLYGSSSRKGGIDNMPPEMKAFGEDHGLAAAELEFEEKENKRGRNEESDNEKSDNSSVSLRDELDKAIETGDWAAVEKQTSDMLVIEKASKNDTSFVKGYMSSDIESDVDTNDRSGWSVDIQSETDTEVIDDERIEILEQLIETDDWQGIVNNSRIHTGVDDSIAEVSGDEND